MADELSLTFLVSIVYWNRFLEYRREIRTKNSFSICFATHFSVVSFVAVSQLLLSVSTILTVDLNVRCMNDFFFSEFDSVCYQYLASKNIPIFRTINISCDIPSFQFGFILSNQICKV